MFFRKNISSLTDQELMESFRKTGKNDYFGELYNRYIPLIYGVCLKYLRQREQAQDAVMQIFEDIHSKILQFEVKEFRTWIYSVARNHCLQLLRKEKKEITVDFSTTFMESDEFMHLIDEEESDKERLAALNKCMEKLAEQQRIAITYFFMEELSYAEIADKTGYRINRIKSYIQNGKRNLSTCLQKHLK